MRGDEDEDEQDDLQQFEKYGHYKYFILINLI